MYNVFLKKNGKLKKAGKVWLENTRKEFYDTYPDGYITFAMNTSHKYVEVGIPCSDDFRVFEVARSVCHPGDKFRPNVGEFLALRRFWIGQTALEVVN